MKSKQQQSIITLEKLNKHVSQINEPPSFSWTIWQKRWWRACVSQTTWHIGPTLVYCLAHRLRLWPNGKPTLGHRLMFSGWWLTRDCEDVAAAGGIKAASCSRPGQASISRGTGTHGCQPLHYLPPQVPRTGCRRWLSAGPASVTLVQHSTHIWPTNVDPRESIHRRW